MGPVLRIEVEASDAGIAEHQVVAGAAAHDVVASAAVEQVAAAAAIDRVLAVTAAHDIQIGVGRAGQDQVVAEVAQQQIRTVVADDGIVTRQSVNDISGVLTHFDVVVTAGYIGSRNSHILVPH